jgi:hypothetical protein
MVVKPRERKETAIKWTVWLLVVIAVCTIMAILANRMDDNARKFSEDFTAKATPIALQKAKDECRQEGLSDTTCNGMSADPAEESSRCGPDLCWIIYITAGDGDQLFASVTIVSRGEGYFVERYTKNTGWEP